MSTASPKLATANGRLARPGSHPTRNPRYPSTSFCAPRSSSLLARLRPALRLHSSNRPPRTEKKVVSSIAYPSAPRRAVIHPTTPSISFRRGDGDESASLLLARLRPLRPPRSTTTPTKQFRPSSSPLSFPVQHAVPFSRPSPRVPSRALARACCTPSFLRLSGCTTCAATVRQEGEGLVRREAR